uniref:Putative secreted protein n=1 Tax=Anopheles marajoara TaxID=58244 RepID=A0A2M4CAM6_9DIPT
MFTATVLLSLVMLCSPLPSNVALSYITASSMIVSLADCSLALTEGCKSAATKRFCCNFVAIGSKFLYKTTASSSVSWLLFKSIP